MSMTTIFFRIPTWGAASPTPCASYMVSSMSLIRILFLNVILVTSLHFFVRTSSPSSRIFLIAITDSPLLFVCHLSYKNSEYIHRIKIELNPHILETLIHLNIPFHPVLHFYQQTAFSSFQIQYPPVQIADLRHIRTGRPDDL